MPLKSVTYTVPTEPADNRDGGRAYIITEMPASRAEWWAWRAWGALANAGVDIPQEIVQLGMVGVALYSLQAFRNASFAEMEPLLREMMACVQVSPSPGVTRALVENDIEEVTTRLALRKAILELHMGFTFADLPSKLRAWSATPA